MKQLLVLTILFVGSFVRAQKMITATLELSDIEVKTKTAIPFCAVQVMDVRFDRSTIGSIHPVKNFNNAKTSQEIVSFPDSFHRYLPQVVQRVVTLDSASKDTLVLLVKQFRLTDRLFNSINRQFEPELLVRLSLSAYCKRENQFTRIFSVDELLSKELYSAQRPRQERIDEYRKEALIDILQTLFTRKTWQGNGTPFSVAMVEQGIQKRFELPLLADTIFPAGLYKTFREFKQNKPSVRNIRLLMKAEKPEAITDSAGKQIDLKDYWGMCDGRKRYIIFRHQPCELITSDHSFYFSSYIQPNELAGRPSFTDYAPQTGLLGAALIKAGENKTRHRFFYLNLDDETVHLEELFGKSTLKELEKELLK